MGFTGPDFLAVDDIRVTDLLGTGLQTGKVTPRIRLTVSGAPDTIRVGSGDQRHILFLLRLRSEKKQ